MGNVITQEASTRIRGDPAQDDLKWLGVDNAAIFHDSYVSDLYDNLPSFDGTMVEEPPPKKDDDGIREDPKIQRLLELFSGRSSQPSVAELFDQQGGSDELEGLTRDFNTNIKMRSRLLQRIHLALIRESKRVRNTLKSSAKKTGTDSLAVAHGSEGQIDPASLLTMASMRVSLSLLKTLRSTNPQIFTDMCESLMALFEALKKVNANKAQRETLQQIADFACTVAQSSKGLERSYALALLFSLGVSRGSVNDLLQVVGLLSEGTEQLPETCLLAPFWRRLGDHHHEFKLSVPNLFNPDGDEVSVKTKAIIAATPGDRGRVAALVSDGTYLYIWSGQAKALEKVGTGLHGTVAGTVYERNDNVLRDIAVLKGLEVGEGGEGQRQEEEEEKADGGEEKDGEDRAPEEPLTPAPSRALLRVVFDAPVFASPSLEADVIHILEVGIEREVLARREADGHSWLQTSDGWICVAMDLQEGSEEDGSDMVDDDVEGGDGEEEDDEDQEDEDDEEEEDDDDDSDRSSFNSLARGQNTFRVTYVELVDGQGGVTSPGGTYSSGPARTGGSDQAVDLCVAWLGYVDGYLFFKAKVDCLQPLEVAVFSAYNLQAQGIMPLALPTIAVTPTTAEAPSPLPSPPVSRTPTSPPVLQPEQGGAAPSVVVGAGDGGGSETGDEPALDNFATSEHGARVTGNPDLPAENTESTVGQRNLLLPQSQRTPDETGATRYVMEGWPFAATARSVQLDLGQERQLARIGLEYGGLAEPRTRPALTGISITTSTDGANFLAWSTEEWSTGQALAAADQEPVFCSLTGATVAADDTPTRGVRYIRVTFFLASGSAALYRLYACGALGSTSSAPKVEPIIPIIISDGRTLLVIHVSRPVIPTRSAAEGSAEATLEEDGEEGQQLHIHVIDHVTGEILRSSVVATDLDQATLHSQGLATNGDHLLLLRLSNGDSRKPVYSSRLIDLKAQEVMEETEMAWEQTNVCSFVPQSFTYDLWNNLVWGLDVPHSKAAFWRNVGFPPRIHGRKPVEHKDLLVSLVPEYRLEALAAEPWPAEQQQQDEEDKQQQQVVARVQAATILTHLDRCAEIYGVPIKEEGQAGGDGANDILVSSAGKDEGSTVRFSVRGQNVSSSCSGTPSRGFNLVVLDSTYSPVDVRTFDTAAGSPYNELLLDYVSRLAEGTMVLVASKDDAASGLSPLGKKALRSMGAEPAVEKLEGSDLFVLIGRKGATPASVVQKIVKRGVGVALVRQKVSLTHVPLSVEPTAQTFSSLIKLVLDNSNALLRDDVDRLQQAQVLGVLSLLTINIYQLVSATTLTSYKEYFDAAQLARLKELLLQCIDSPPQANQGSRHISDSALKLFVTAIDVFYPTATQRCNLLVEYITQYVQGILSPFEASVLGLLLKRISNPSSLIQLLDEQSKGGPSAVGGSASLDLFNSVLDISKSEAEVALEASCWGGGVDQQQQQQQGEGEGGKGAIGRSAVVMLSSLVNQLLSQAVQSIVVATEKAGEQGKDGTVVDVNVLLHIFTRLSDSSAALLDKAIESAHTLSIPVLPHADDMPRRNGGAHSPKSSATVAPWRATMISRDMNSVSFRQPLSMTGAPLGPVLTRELDVALNASPVGALLPLLTFVVIELVRYQSAALIPVLDKMAKAVGPLTERVRKAVDLLPKNKRLGQRTTIESAPRKKVLTFESSHPYQSNANDTIILSMPKAERMTIVFDQQSATERDYDYLIFWKDDSRTERWHPEEKLTGRNGSENFPGFGGRAPLVIEGDYANIEFHSDGSNEDWGWRFTAAGEYKKQTVMEEIHWLVQLDKHLSACGACLAKGLTVSVEWGGELEERNIMWMEDETLSTHSTSSPSELNTSYLPPPLSGMMMIPPLPPPVPSPPSPRKRDGAMMMMAAVQAAAPHVMLSSSSSTIPPACPSPRRGGGTGGGQWLDPEAEASFLQSLVQRPGPDSLGAKLVQKMRSKVREDRGCYESIDNAVYASMAALIKHNGLSAEAMAVATDTREDIPESLVRVWKSGVKMRQFFQYGDVQAAHRREVEGSNNMPSVLERGPSIYSGAEDAVIDKTSKEIVEKAHFLLRLDTPRSVKSFARQRWALMSQYQRAKSFHGENEGDGVTKGTEDKWAAVVSELHASYKLKSIFEYRRKASEKKRNARLTVTERLLRFLQMPAKIEEIEAIKDKRNRRAAHRADGIVLATTLLTQSSSPHDQIFLLSCFMKAMRECRHSKDSSTTHVHYLNGVEGCSVESAARLTEAFSQFLKATVEILRSHESYVTGISSKSPPPGTDKQAVEGLLAATLQACSLDYDVKDHELIEESDLVNVLSHYLSASSPSLRAAAWKLFESLLPRAPSADDSDARTLTEEPTNVSKQLLALATRQLEAIARSSKALTPVPTTAASKLVLGDDVPHVILIENAVQLGRDMVGPVAAHIPLNINTSFSLWLYRPKNALDNNKAGGAHGSSSSRIHEGSRVQRGPDWMYQDQDRTDDRVNTGTVTSVDGTSVTVQWDDDTDKYNYRWGEEVEGKKAYDVVLVDPESGGTLLYKGATRLLEAKERHSWSAFHVSLNDAAQLTFRVVQGEKGWYTVTGASRIPAETWVHVAVTTSAEGVNLYLNGTEDASKPLHPDLLQVGPVKKNVVEVESPHPYNPDMEEDWIVEHPDAEGYTVTFSSDTRTERTYDYVQLFSADDGASTFGEKYSGGLGGTERLFPGLDGQPPLEINAPRFRVFFKSDRSNQDWGFKLIATVKLREGAAAGLDEEEVVEISDLNPNPIYLGQPPSYICHDQGARGLIANVVVFKKTLNEDSIKKLSCVTTAELPTSFFESERCLDVVSLLDKSIRVMPPPTLRAMTTPGVLEAVLRLSSAPHMDARLSATRLCEVLLPYADPKLVDLQSSKLEPASSSSSSPPPTLSSSPGGIGGGKRSAFITSLLLKVGKVLASSTEHRDLQQRQLAVDGADSVFGLTAGRLHLLRCLVMSETWGPIIKGTIVDILQSMPEVLKGIEEVIDAEAVAAPLPGGGGSSPPPERLLLTAVLGLLGGYMDSLWVGGPALVELEDKKGVFENCTVLAFTHCPPIDTTASADKDKTKTLKQTWRHLGGFGDAVVVVLHSEPSKAVIYPRTKVMAQPARDAAFLTGVVEAAGPDLILSAFKDLLRVDLSSRLPAYQPKTVEEDKVEVIESEHPYQAQKEKRWKLDFPGAKKMEISFDEQTRTDFGSVFVRFLKTEQGASSSSSEALWGEEKYTGRDRQQNWPGLQGRPPLVIPASSCVVSFHVDGDSSDWGFKLTAKAHTVTVVPPPERPPLTSYAALVQLYLQGMKALATIIESVPAFVRSASAVTPLLVEAALLKPRTNSQYIKKAEPMTLETKHPYDCNEDRYETVSFPGAKKILLVFDPQTNSEKGCDYLRFYKGTERTDYWGENQYSGGKDGSAHNWPGLGTNAPMEIPADHCVIYWHTDGSVVDWGWKLTLIPDFGKGDGLEKMPTSEVMTRSYFMSKYLHDGPMAQELPKALESFELNGHHQQGEDSREKKAGEGMYDGSILLGPIEPSPSEERVDARLPRDSVVGRTFIVNYQDTEKVPIRAEPRSDSSSLGLLEAETGVMALEESMDWLRVKHLDVEGWVLRREGDLIYLVPSDASAEGLVSIPSEGISSRPGEGSGTQRTNPMYECTDTVSAATDKPMLAGLLPADCLRGQTLRLLSALTDSAQFGALGFARQSVSALISNWPEREPFSLSVFGGASQFLRFLRISFEQEKNDIKNSPRLAVLKQKILQVLRGDKEDAHAMAVALVSFSIQQLQECSELQSMIKPTKARMCTLETAHNYPDSADDYWPLHFPGAKRIKLVFDQRCSTEHNCDYVVIYKDGMHSTDNRWTPVNYTGRQNDLSGKNWPGVNGRDPLYIESDHCEIHFHSDGSNNDWGVKIYCYGIMSEPTPVEVEEFREKKELSAGSLELACWLLEFIASEPLPAVQEGLYSKLTLRTLRKYMESAEEKDKMWMVHLVSSMLGNLGLVKRLSPVAAAEVRRLVVSLKEMAIAQFKAEESNSADRKSSLLQTLIQATVLGESSPVLSPDYYCRAASSSSGDDGDERDPGGVSESKEEGTLRDEKTDEPDRGAPAPTVLAWSKVLKSSSIILQEEDRLASFSPVAEAGTGIVLSSRAVSRGSQTWRLCLVSLGDDAPITIGAVPASFSPLSASPHQLVGQAPETFGWSGGKLYSGASPSPVTPVSFGPMLKAGDVISVTLDSSRGTFYLTRNKAQVGLAFGPPDSGAAMEVPSGLLDGGVAYRLAVVLPAGSSIRLLTPEAISPEDQTLTSSLAGGDPTASFFDKVRDAVDYLRAFSERRIPSVLVRKEFLAPLRERHKVVLESAHPFDGKGFTREVTIPGATGLEVRLDWNTCVGRADVLEMSSHDEAFLFKGLEHGTDASSSVGAIGVGDLVVRGPAWEWAEQDGGAGSKGEVMEVKSWKGKTNAGIVVHWLDMDYTALYRWGYEGKYDLLYFGPGSRSSRPIHISSNTVKLALTTFQDDSPNDANQTESSGLWKGALRFNEPQAGLALPQDASYDLLGDFTIESWVRTGPHLDATQAIVSRGVDLSMDGQQMHQLYLRVTPDGQLAFSMMNTDMQLGVSLSGGKVMAGKWTHTAVSMHDRIVRLYVHGVEVCSDSFHGDRLDTLGATLSVGNYIGRTDPWDGHMYDFRVWTRTLATAKLASFGKSPLKPLESKDGLVARFLTPTPSMEGLASSITFNTAREDTGDGGGPPAVMSGAHWDERVEALDSPSQPGQPWGYKITVLPVYPIDSLSTIPGVAAEFTAFAEPYLSKGDLRHDLALVRYVNSVAQKKGIPESDLLSVKWDDITPAEADLVRLPLLRELMSGPTPSSSFQGPSPPDMTGSTSSMALDKSTGGGGGATAGAKKTPVKCRYIMVQLLNTCLKDVLSLIDLGTIDKAWSMAAYVSKCRGLIYTVLKQPIWTDALTSTAVSSNTFDLKLSKSKAAKYYNQVDHEARTTVFSQAFRQIHPINPRQLRRSDKLYQVYWMGERSHDAGGPYRESWSFYCSELQSPALPLLRRTQNGIHAIGQNREQWVLNPGATTATHLELFFFLGKIMGMVVRNQEFLNLDLSTVVWKLLVQDSLTLEDLEAVDVEFVRSLRTIRNTPEEAFEESFSWLDFTTQSSDEQTVELVPDGANQPVTFHNRLDYVRLLEHYRLHEFDRQAAAIRAGLATIVPQRLLALFSWEELETMICGQKQVDVELLKSVTEYSSCRAEDQHVRFFWQTLENFTNEERSMFLRFCWGRSRLPLRADAFSQRFKLQSFGRSPPDMYLPVSHTCFFSLELPAYSTLEVMQHKITYAIYNCQAIDGDDTSVGMQAASLGWEGD